MATTLYIVILIYIKEIEKNIIILLFFILLIEIID